VIDVIDVIDPLAWNMSGARVMMLLALMIYNIYLR
jgi:hypothetical protein